MKNVMKFENSVAKVNVWMTEITDGTIGLECNYLCRIEPKRKRNAIIAKEYKCNYTSEYKKWFTDEISCLIAK